MTAERMDYHEALLDAVRAGDLDLTGTLARKLHDADRKKILAAIRKFVSALPPDQAGSPAFTAAELAGLAGQATPAAATQWLVAMGRRRQRHSWYSLMPAESLDVLSGRDPAWLGELAHLLAAELDKGKGFGGGQRPINHLIRPLIRMSGCATPTNPGYAALWMVNSGGLGDLRAAPETATLLPIALEMEGAGAYIEGHDKGYVEGAEKHGSKDPANPSLPWKEKLVRLTESGELGRAVLIDLCVGRLLRGGRPYEVRCFRSLLESLRLTDDDIATRATDWARLAADADAPTASAAMGFLRRMVDAERPVDGDLLADASRDILARPEKALVRTHLVLLGRALDQDGYPPSELLPAVAVAFGHEDGAVQEQAWKIVARHLAAVDAAARTRIVEAVPALTPDLRDKVTADLGVAEPADEPYRETLPPISSPVRAAATPLTVAEVVQGVVAECAADSPDAAAWTEDSERILDGLVRVAHRDRAALTEALGTLTYPYDWTAQDEPPGAGVALVAKVLVGKVGIDELPALPRRLTDPPYRAMDGETIIRGVWQMRTWEVARRITTDMPPFLLATPSWSTGAVDADVLVDRLAAYARLNLPAGSADFDQALLRVRIPQGPDREQFVAAAAGLGTPEGARLADWFSGEGLQPVEEDDRLVLPVVRETFTDPFRRLGDKLGWSYDALELPRWVSTLPLLRGYVAAQSLWRGACSHHGEGGQWAGDLPLLVQADGSIGPCIEAVVAEGLARAGEAARPGVVEGLLQLVARGELDTVRCGAHLSQVNVPRLRPFTPPEVLDVLSEVARTGAYATVWGILLGALPGLLPEGRRPRQLGALLSLAVECASRCGETGSITGLDAVADSKGSSQTIKQARRLRDYLTRAAERVSS
ncbi:DUF6493 family protein [Actinoplanes auranticolor]|uniref:Secreted protein n=1 Tax=Actinoplanes auranticolor TaxID=47988 RepID=A0A919S8I0_9ACTN|nr:DUF6493 family protein [Actinoplanes auranticolor]GIM66198.1 hypothetical protein Aau02nite_22100 [Actinoplanes auranticolor]